jgi:hypothetical protein
MELSKRFANAALVKIASINDLKQHCPYVIKSVRRKTTKYGSTLVLTIEDGGEKCCVFLPKRYYDSFTDKDITDINDGEINMDLVYNGICEKTRAYKLSLQVCLK